MSSRVPKWILFLPWIFLMPYFIRYFMIWEELPQTLAVHFDISGNPNTWMGRGWFLLFSTVFLFVDMGIFTWILTKLRVGATFHLVLGLFYFSAAGEVALFWQVLNYNLGFQPVWWAGVAAVGLGTAFVAALLIVFASWGNLFSSSGRNLSGPGKEKRILSEEVHRSKWRFWINVPFALIPLAVWFLCPLLPCRILAVLGFLIGLYVIALIWTGFRYRFSEAGVEVRGLWRPFLFIPAQEIQDYEAATCRPLRDYGGWGVRGLGSSRAFIWGSNGVRINTFRGQVFFLGSENPDMIIRRLDDLKKGTL